MQFDREASEMLMSGNHSKGLDKNYSIKIDNVRINELDSKFSDLNGSGMDFRKESNASSEKMIGKYYDFSLIPERTVQ